MIGDFCVAHGLGAVSLRYFNVAGASGGVGEDHDPETHLIPNILRAALGQRTHVEIYGTDYPTRTGPRSGTTSTSTISRLRTLLALDGARARRAPDLQPRQRQRLLGARGDRGGRAGHRATRSPTSEAPRRPGDPPMLVAASEQIRAELGWEPASRSSSG